MRKISLKKRLWGQACYLPFKSQNRKPDPDRRSAVNRPAILLIEQGIRTLWEQHYHNTIFFNRYNIAQSIEEVKQRIHKSQLQPPQNTDAAAWLLAGVGILALLALLSSDKK